MRRLEPVAVGGPITFDDILARSAAATAGCLSDKLAAFDELLELEEEDAAAVGTSDGLPSPRAPGKRRSSLRTPVSSPAKAGEAAQEDGVALDAGSEFSDMPVPPANVLYGRLVVCVDWLTEMETVAAADWCAMILPSVFTKLFGRILMVLKVISYQGFSQFILQNLMYAPVIALIAGTVVFFYRVYEQYNQGQSLWQSIKLASPYFLKTALKFFMVYMGWVIAMATVNFAGWFAGSFATAAAIIIAVSIAGLAFARLAHYLIDDYAPEHAKWLKTAANFFAATSVFAGVAASAYFLSATIAGLLVVGGITAAFLFAASMITDVIFDQAQDTEKAWKMISRAYFEGTVWALVEHVAINVVIGGVMGGIIDVFCVTTAVCAAIFVGGMVDGNFRRMVRKYKDLLQPDDLAAVHESIKRIKKASLERKQAGVVVREQSISMAAEFKAMADKHKKHPDEQSLFDQHIEQNPRLLQADIMFEINAVAEKLQGHPDERSLFDGYIKQELALKLLRELDVTSDVDQFEKDYREVINYIKLPRKGVAPGGFCPKEGPQTFAALQRALAFRRDVLMGKPGVGDWAEYAGELRQKLQGRQNGFRANIQYKHKIDLDPPPKGGRQNVDRGPFGLFSRWWAGTPKPEQIEMQAVQGV